MNSFTLNNRRIAKNTVFLYFRTFIVMLISLYTSRVVLDVLGETDFGIYNIVGGIVVLFTFLNSAMSAATQRYLNYELGRNNIDEVKRIFSTSINVHIGISLIVFILGEIIGLYFVMSQLNIPQERFSASIWVYHLSLIGCCINILRIPYNACIIAYERMSFYAYVSIVEVILKLVIVFLLMVGSFDRLIEYALLMLLVLFITSFVYYFYCHKKFPICHYQWIWDKVLFKKLLSFSGWSMLGSIATTMSGQGSSILLNVFHGVSLNAAMGLSYQVHSAVASFVSSFQTAFTPQLVKIYATKQYNEFTSLVCSSSRLSYCLVFLIALPLMVCINTILQVWLTIVPNYTAEFIILTIINCIIDALSGPLWVAVQATGNIRRYQIIMSFLILLNLPFMYLCLFWGLSPIVAVFVRTIIYVLTHFFRIAFLNYIMDFPTTKYLKDVMLRIFIMTLIALPFSIYLQKYTNGILQTVLVFMLLLIQNILLVWMVGIKQEERKAIITMIKLKFCK